MPLNETHAPRNMDRKRNDLHNPLSASVKAASLKPETEWWGCHWDTKEAKKKRKNDLAQIVKILNRIFIHTKTIMMMIREWQRCIKLDIDPSLMMIDCDWQKATLVPRKPLDQFKWQTIIGQWVKLPSEAQVRYLTGFGTVVFHSSSSMIALWFNFHCKGRIWRLQASRNRWSQEAVICHE